MSVRETSSGNILHMVGSCFSLNFSLEPASMIRLQAFLVTCFWMGAVIIVVAIVRNVETWERNVRILVEWGDLIIAIHLQRVLM